MNSSELNTSRKARGRERLAELLRPFSKFARIRVFDHSYPSKQHPYRIVLNHSPLPFSLHYRWTIKRKISNQSIKTGNSSENRQGYALLHREWRIWLTWAQSLHPWVSLLSIRPCLRTCLIERNTSNLLNNLQFWYWVKYKVELDREGDSIGVLKPIFMERERGWGSEIIRNVGSAVGSLEVKREKLTERNNSSNRGVS